jgi:pyrimidine operon attenuation protein / uracil phosphoribosyltransferase
VKRVLRGSYDRSDMQEYNERQARRGLAFLPKSQLLSSDEVARALTRMAHEIVERNHELASVSLIGLQTGGEPFVRRIASLLGEISGDTPPVGLLDVSFYRDDLSLHPAPRSSLTLIDHDLTERSVVLVDDVLFTGRTIRAALNALTDWGRPRAVQLAVMVDRGHRELPIRPDFVGKNLPTSIDEDINATIEGVWIGSRESS